MKAAIVGTPQVQVTMTLDEATLLLALIGQFGNEVTFSQDLYGALIEVLGEEHEYYTKAAKAGTLALRMQAAIVKRASMIQKIT